MVHKFLPRTTFTSQEDFKQNFSINVPDNFNFGYDIVDEWAKKEPNKLAMLWTNDKGEERRYTFADIKQKTDQTASYFQSLGIGKGDAVMLILKRRAEFWFSSVAITKLGGIVVPATHLLTKKDIVYRCNAADIKMIVCAGEEIIENHILEALPECPTLKELVSVGPDYAEGFKNFQEGIDNAAPFVRPEVRNNNDETMLLYFTSGTSGHPKMVAHDFTYPLGMISVAMLWHNLRHKDIVAVK